MEDKFEIAVSTADMCRMVEQWLKEHYLAHEPGKHVRVVDVQFFYNPNLFRIYIERDEPANLASCEASVDVEQAVEQA